MRSNYRYVYLFGFLFSLFYGALSNFSFIPNLKYVAVGLRKKIPVRTRRVVLPLDRLRGDLRWRTRSRMCYFRARSLAGFWSIRDRVPGGYHLCTTRTCNKPTCDINFANELTNVTHVTDETVAVR